MTEDRFETEDDRTRKRCEEQGCVWEASYKGRMQCKWCGSMKTQPRRKKVKAVKPHQRRSWTHIEPGRHPQ